MSYKKGKDIKQQGDCLVYCYTRRIEILTTGIERYSERTFEPIIFNKPEGFEKW